MKKSNGFYYCDEEAARRGGPSKDPRLPPSSQRSDLCGPFACLAPDMVLDASLGFKVSLRQLDNINLDCSSLGDHQIWANQSARENCFHNNTMPEDTSTAQGRKAGESALAAQLLWASPPIAQALLVGIGALAGPLHVQ